MLKTPGYKTRSACLSNFGFADDLVTAMKMGCKNKTKQNAREDNTTPTNHAHTAQFFFLSCNTPSHVVPRATRTGT